MGRSLSVVRLEDETAGNCHDNGCLLIRVAAPGRGSLTARLTWTNAATALGLFVSMQKGTGASGASPLQVSAQVLDRGEILLLVSFENPPGPASAQLFELVTFVCGTTVAEDRCRQRFAGGDAQASIQDQVEGAAAGE